MVFFFAENRQVYSVLLLVASEICFVFLQKGKTLKVALFFGSFNPVHIGHLAIANYVVTFTEFKNLWFVVSPHNPLKKKESLLDGYLRSDLLHTAIGNYDQFKINNIEFSMPQPSFTIDTLTALSEKYPQNKFALLMGADNLKSLHKWKNYEMILNNYRILVYPRPQVIDIPVEFINHPSVQLIDAPIMEVSSTMIRKSIKEGKNIRFFLPDNVYNKIEKEGYYL
jgi:nicotinate-nucleotide adenylyltransferase